MTGVVDALVAARPVRISPDRASIRLMGTRFVLDSFILDQLLYPNVGTADKPRLAALGARPGGGVRLGRSPTACSSRTGETAYANYDAQLDADARGGRRAARRRTGAAPSTTRGSTRSSRCSSPHGDGLPGLHAHETLGGQGARSRRSAPTPS